MSLVPTDGFQRFLAMHVMVNKFPLSSVVDGNNKQNFKRRPVLYTGQSYDCPFKNNNAYCTYIISCFNKI